MRNIWGIIVSLSWVMGCSSDGTLSDAKISHFDSGARKASIVINTNCKSKGKGTIELTKKEYGKSLSCTFSKKEISLSYDGLGYRFYLNMGETSYEGPKKYSFENDKGFCPFPEYSPLTISSQDKSECMGGLCPLFGFAQKSKCEITIEMHTDVEVSGSYKCSGDCRFSDKGGSCVLNEPIEVSGRFNYGPQDCL